LPFLVCWCIASSAHAQSFEVGVNLLSSQMSEFDGTDIGVGGRFTWKPVPLVGIDADLGWYPGEYPPDGIPFSDGRVEGFFGVTVGPSVNRVRPFGKFAAGFFQTAATQEAIACLAIYPPPLNCVMAAGQTLPAMDVGGGVELLFTDRTFLRIDATARMLQYPGPSLQLDHSDRTVHEKDYWGAAFRLSVGGGFRF
jgi:hypothetical protein